MNATGLSAEQAQACLPLVFSDPSGARQCGRPGVIQVSANASDPIPSIVEKAGMGRFFYLQGKSGHRYIFSSTAGDQAEQYHHAIFASVDAQGMVEVTTQIEQIRCNSRDVFVHFLGEKKITTSDVIGDLCPPATGKP